MKVYKSVRTGELVAANSCEECPHKKAEAYNSNGRFSASMVCTAIQRESTNKDSLGKPYRFHPPIRESKFWGGFLRDCPLEDV